MLYNLEPGASWCKLVQASWHNDSGGYRKVPQGGVLQIWTRRKEVAAARLWQKLVLNGCVNEKEFTPEAASQTPIRYSSFHPPTREQPRSKAVLPSDRRSLRSLSNILSANAANGCQWVPMMMPACQPRQPRASRLTWLLGSLLPLPLSLLDSLTCP